MFDKKYRLIRLVCLHLQYIIFANINGDTIIHDVARVRDYPYCISSSLYHQNEKTMQKAPITNSHYDCFCLLSTYYAGVALGFGV